MTNRARSLQALGAIGAALAIVLSAAAAPAAARRHLLMVVDGLRPDYVTPEVMPNLTALGKRGVVFRRHHSVYPTVTRVNGSSIATGSYPDAHGLLGNSVFFPKVDPRRFLDTADRNSLLKVAESEGRLLTAPTLGELLQAAGRRMLVVSSGSTGSAFLLNPTLAGGAILHYQYALPEEMRQELKVLGPAPSDRSAAGALDRYAVDAFLKVGLPRVDPSVTVMWLSDLDSMAHDKGIGDPATVDILRRVDENLKRIEDGLRAAKRFDDYDIWVTSDHGFSTYSGAVDVAALLRPFAGTLPDGTPRVVSGGGAIYVRDGDEAAVTGIVRALQQAPGAGAIFTRGREASSFEGHVPGTLAFSAVHWNHERSAQVLFSPDWSDAPNTHGAPGASASNGVAGHGSSSPWDIHNTLIAAGPDLKRGEIDEVPSGNVDFLPTFLKLLGLTVPASVQGRSLDEAIAGGPAASSVTVRTTQQASSTSDGSYTVSGTFSTVEAGGAVHRYFDQAKAYRR